MSYDLIVYLPNHGYIEDDPVFISWLGGLYYVNDPDTDSFKLTDTPAGWVVQYTSDVTSGYVRKIDTSTGTAVISGLGHLEGETVYVTAFGENLGSFVVTNGEVQVLGNVYTYQVGKPYAAKVRTMRFSVPGDGNVQTRIKRIVEITVRLHRSKGGQIGQEADGVEYMSDVDADYSNKTTDHRSEVKAGHDRDGYAVVKSVKPYPQTVLGIVTELET